jgi:hypothetical protein
MKKVEAKAEKIGGAVFASLWFVPALAEVALGGFVYPGLAFGAAYLMGGDDAWGLLRGYVSGAVVYTGLTYAFRRKAIEADADYLKDPTQWTTTQHIEAMYGSGVIRQWYDATQQW